MNKNLNYQIVDKILRLKHLGREIEISFEFPIRQAVLFEEKLLVRIEPEVRKICNENVFCVSLEGKILWQIAPTPHIYVDSPYTGIGKDGKYAKLYNWDGTDLIVNPSTGEIIKKSFSK